MQVIDIPINQISAALWNANEMDPEMRTKLRRSITRFDIVVPALVREVAPGCYETIGGAQRSLTHFKANGLEVHTVPQVPKLIYVAFIDATWKDRLTRPVLLYSALETHHAGH